MSCGYRCTQYVVALGLLLTLGLYVTAGAVNYWWIIDTNVYKKEKGLWKECESLITESTCETREDFMQFKYGKDIDIIFLGLAVGALTSLVSLILIGATMCQRYPSKLVILIEIIILFFGAAGGGLSLAWSLLKIEMNEGEKYGWALYCLYGGVGMNVLTFAFSIVLLCIRAPGAYRSTNKDDEIAMLAQ